VLALKGAFRLIIGTRGLQQTTSSILRNRHDQPGFSREGVGCAARICRGLRVLCNRQIMSCTTGRAMPAFAARTWMTRNFEGAIEEHSKQHRIPMTSPGQLETRIQSAA